MVSAPSRSRGLGRLLQQVRPRDGLHGVSDPAGGPVQSFKFPLRFDSRRAASLKSAGLARKMRFAAVLPGPSAPWAGPAGEYFENQAAYRTFKALRPFAPGPSFDPHGRPPARPAAGRIPAQYDLACTLILPALYLGRGRDQLRATHADRRPVASCSTSLKLSFPSSALGYGARSVFFGLCCCGAGSLCEPVAVQQATPIFGIRGSPPLYWEVRCFACTLRGSAAQAPPQRAPRFGSAAPALVSHPICLVHCCHPE